MLLGSRCSICSRPGKALCGACVDRLTPAGPLHPPPGLDSLVGLITYEGAGRDLVVAFKFHNTRASLSVLTAALSRAVDTDGLDFVTWAPTTRRHRRTRGFDQAELLARSLARTLALPCRGLLCRQPGPSQTGRSLTERATGVRFTSKQFTPMRFRSCGVLIVDDVVTTGATLSAAGDALRAGGATLVRGAVLAATP